MFAVLGGWVHLFSSYAIYYAFVIVILSIFASMQINIIMDGKHKRARACSPKKKKKDFKASFGFAWSVFNETISRK